MGFLSSSKLAEYTNALMTKLRLIFATKNMVGAPKKASTVSEMVDTNSIYVYTGSEAGYTFGDWYYYENGAWLDGAVYNAVAFDTDTTLTQPGEAADAAATGLAIGRVFSENSKRKLLSILRSVDAWTIPNPISEIDDLEELLFPGIEAISIDAVYTQGSSVIYAETSLDSLRSNLVVTATLSDGSTEVITDYTLSGTLVTGTSTVTVSYLNLTDTFDVVVSATPTEVSITALYTQGSTVVTPSTPLDSLKSDLVVSVIYSDNNSRQLDTSEYQLSGTLAVGTSTVTVTYKTFSTTFTVNVILSDIQLCEWISTEDNTNWIKTGLTPADNLGYKLTVLPLVANSGTIMGCRSSSSIRYWVYVENNEVWIGWNTSRSSGKSYTTGTPFTAEVNYKNSRKVYVNGSESTLQLSTLPTVGNYYIALLGRNAGGEYAGTPQKFYGCEFTSGGDVVANIVPAYKHSTGEVGVYDKISDTFIGNSNTSGTATGFSKGADI